MCRVFVPPIQHWHTFYLSSCILNSDFIILRELEEMSKGENIVKLIKGQRISWLGHLERMEEDRMPKKIYTQEVEGSRRRGRPRKRWEEEVERDLQSAGSEKMERVGGR